MVVRHVEDRSDNFHLYREREGGLGERGRMTGMVGVGKISRPRIAKTERVFMITDENNRLRISTAKVRLISEV